MIAFTVAGKPQPQGSTRAFVPKGWKRAIITSDNKSLRPWRQDVAAQAKAAMGGALPSEGPIRISCKFFFLKPKSAKKSILHKTTKPDIDKLLRAIMDGVTGICFLDDAQVVACDATKDFCWSGGERAEVEVHGARFGEPAPFHVGAPAADRTEDGW